MIRGFDHLTVCVRDLDLARRFFGVLGFEEDKAVVIRGETVAAYMGIPGIVADHVTLVLPGVEPRQEIQLLHYRAPEAADDPGIRDLGRLGPTTSASPATRSSSVWRSKASGRAAACSTSTAAG